MNQELLEILKCPKTGENLLLENPSYEGNLIKSGILVSEQSKNKYEINNFIPRFVPISNYADNFGFQWNHFSNTQLDSNSGHPISSNRFWKATEWKPEEMKGKWILDIGCGSGRFAEIALSSECNLVALDYSNAVDACLKNLKHYPNLHVVQGNVYELPFKKEAFSFVYSLGVLQHTPDVKKSFFCSLPYLKVGGMISVDFYEKTWKALLLPKFWLRPITKRINKSSLFNFLQKIVPILLSISIFLEKIHFLGSLLKRTVPVANYHGILPLSKEQLYEWALLDTFDWLSPEYDNPQDENTVRSWFEEAGLLNIKIHRVSHLVANGIKSDK
ncbi:class I SAM-dependent methyltransferase [Leptospira vanthielii]|uniref:Methyltransferase domain protein n=1 Tax=Leptospira vanthielii serovar Holland str. Waz Holland = ATCC 700522 TaxID=1218591 RepID=N1W8G5_9LEPT|nr:class I SAM-dependent methyltransferase [Leptospira vanthielii]EMY69497.1 methyltransferase domain protein [Leptospira vanthielii serovar Holland str. Waz Holland = ATCC 700522]